MVTPDLYDVPRLMAQRGLTEDDVLKLGLEADGLVFMVVVPELGACRVPDVALWHFMAGDDEYAADAMPEHWSKQPSGPRIIKRDRLRVLADSWEKHLILSDGIRARLQAYLEQEQSPATPAPVVAVGALGEPDKAAPVKYGLLTNEIADTFDGVNGWSAARWPKNLSASQWLHPARIALGAAGGASSTWNPLRLAQLMHGETKGDKAREQVMKAFNSRFNRCPVLKPWRDAFNEYFATHCTTD